MIKNYKKMSNYEKYCFHANSLKTLINDILPEFLNISKQMETVKSVTLYSLLEEIHKTSSEIMFGFSCVTEMNVCFIKQSNDYVEFLKNNTDGYKNQLEDFIESYRESPDEDLLYGKLVSCNLSLAIDNLTSFNTFYQLASLAIIIMLHLNMLEFQYALTLNSIDKHQKAKEAFIDLSTFILGLIPEFSWGVVLYDFAKQTAEVVNSLDDDFIKHENNNITDMTLLKLEKQIELLKAVIEKQKLIENLLKKQLHLSEENSEELKKDD